MRFHEAKYNGSHGSDYMDQSSQCMGDRTIDYWPRAVCISIHKCCTSSNLALTLVQCTLLRVHEYRIATLQSISFEYSIKCMILCSTPFS